MTFGKAETKMNCQHCQPLLLDHLYGLLDGPDAAAVDAHLASCPECASARAETARVQGLIAKAAKGTFPNTRFEAPAPAPSQPGTRTPAPAAAPAVLPFPAPKPAGRTTRTIRVANIIPWAVAAAVLIAIPGTVVPVLSIFDRADAANRAADTATYAADAANRDAESAAGAVEAAKKARQNSLSAAQLRLTVAEQTQTALLNSWVKEQKAAEQTAGARKLNVNVLKPATVQPGAPNDFLVVVRDGRDGWESTSKRMFAEVHAVDASDAVIFSQPLDHIRRGEEHSLRLPAAAWAQVKPNAELFLVVAQVDEKGVRTELQERVRLAGPVFTTLLVTDKPTYRPGERLFFRSLTLDRITFRTPAREQILKYELMYPDNRVVNGLTVTGTTDLVRVGAGEGKVEAVRTADGQPVRGVGCGEFVLPPDLADGDYTLVLREQQHPAGLPATVPLPVTRLVKVRSGVADNYRKQIEFPGRVSYVAGETVVACADLMFQDKPVPNATIATVEVQADGKQLGVQMLSNETDKDGKVNLRFALPAELLDGDVRLKVAFRTAHGEEVVARRVPVIGNRLQVEFFPECGNTLVAGVPCKVYVRATTPAGQPADIRGIITDGREVLARVESLHDDSQPGANRGLASFIYTPKLGGRAWLKLDAPAGIYAPILPGVPVPNAAVALMGGPGATAIRTGFPLPPPVDSGIVMSVLDPITAPGQPIRVQLHSVGQARTLVVGAYTRGRLSDTQKVTVEPDLPQIVKLMAGNDPRGGVVRITAFEELPEVAGEPKPDLKPVAERLVFRKPGEVLNLAFAVSSVEAETIAVPAPKIATFRAGAAVNLSITATNEKGHPAAAVLWAAAVNSGVSPGPKDRLMPTHFLLAGEVKNPDDLEYADFLLTDHPKAGEALDLVLGTQGWRRFAEQEQSLQPLVPAVRAAGGANMEEARLRAQNGQYATWTEPASLRNDRKLFETYAPLYEAAVKAVAEAKAALQARDETFELNAISKARLAAESAKRTAEESAKRTAAEAVKAEAAREPVRQFRSAVWYGVAGLAALALCCGLASLARPNGRFPLGLSTVGSVGLAAFLVIAAGWGDDAKASAAAPASTSGEHAKTDLAEPGVGARRGDRDAAVPVLGIPAPAPMGVAPKPQTAPDGKKSNTLMKPKIDANFGGGAGGGGPGKGPPGMAYGGPPKGIPFSPSGPTTPSGPIGSNLPGGPSALGPILPPSVVPNTGIGPNMRPVPVIPAPPGAPSPATGGFSVSEDDLVKSEGKFNLSSGSAGRTEKAAEQADSLRRATDRAAEFANERALVLQSTLDAYHTAVGKQPVPAQPLADKFTAQQARVLVPPLVVREYAAPRPTPIQLSDAEAPDTVLWQPVIVLPADGKATLTFHLGAAPGGYQVLIAGHTADGRLGATRGLIPVTRPPTPMPVGPGAPGGSVPPIIPVAPGPRPMP